MTKHHDEKLMSVQIEQEYDVLKKDWEHRVYIKLFVALRTSGLLKALGDKHFRSLIALALYMDKDGKCYPSLEELAETLGVSKTSASNRYKELCNFRWKGQPIVTRRDLRDPKTRERIGTEYTILVDSIRIFDQDQEKTVQTSGEMPSSSFLEVGENPDSTPSSSFLEVGENPDSMPSSSFLEVGQISQCLPEKPEMTPSSRKPKLGQPKLGLDEPNYIELNTEINTEYETVKTECDNESNTEQQPQEKKKSINITLDEIANLALDSSFLPENFPPKFTEAVKKVRDDLETIRYYFDIAKAAHKDAEKRLKEQLQDPDFEFGDTYFDDDVAAAAFLSTIGQAKLGKIEESIEAHFRGNVRSRLVRKELALMQALEKKEKQDQFVLYDWVNKE